MWNFDLLREQKPEVAEAMDALGHAGPTARASDKQVKGGYQSDDGWHTTYYTSNDLVRISEGLLETAKWLDCRAMSDETPASRGSA